MKASTISPEKELNQKGYKLHQVPFFPKAVRTQAEESHIGCILGICVAILSQQGLDHAERLHTPQDTNKAACLCTRKKSREEGRNPITG